MMRKMDAVDVKCPKCGAKPGERCEGPSAHGERWGEVRGKYTDEPRYNMRSSEVMWKDGGG